MRKKKSNVVESVIIRQVKIQADKYTIKILLLFKKCNKNIWLRKKLYAVV